MFARMAGPYVLRVILSRGSADSRATVGQEDAFFLPLHCLSVRRAPDAVRERLALPTDSVRAALLAARRDPRIHRLVVLSTCQRVELYAAFPPDIRDGRARLTEWLASARGMPATEVDAFADYHRGIEAARHLCRVASGLDAAILGEAQVLSQVAGALRHAVSAHTVTPLLKDVFRAAVGGAEKARRSVWSAFRAADIGMAAASGAERALGRLAGSAAVVVGAGEVAELSVRALQARGVARVTIVNRTRERAEAIATHGARSASFDEMGRVVSDADIVIVATGAPCVIVEAPMVRAAIARRTDRPLVIVDTALPRNVDPAVRAIHGARLLDLSDLRPLFVNTTDERRGAVAAVEALIDVELRELRERRQGLGHATVSLAIA